MDQGIVKNSRLSRYYHPKCINAIYLILLLQIGLVKSVAENFYNPDYEEEFLEHERALQEETTNPSQNGIYYNSNSPPETTHPLENLEKELKGDEMTKRHLGALAAMSGTKQKTDPHYPGTLISQMPKRHLGAVAALSGMRQTSPRETFMLKRHFGSAVASKSGFRSHSPISAIGRLSSDSQGLGKRHMGALARTNSKPFTRIVKSDGIPDYENSIGDDGFFRENYVDTEHFYDYPIDIPLVAEPNNSPISSDITDGDNEEFLDEPVPLKNKRFLGSLARVGWFPRQFRGIISENPYDKRHIGSAARMGWLPMPSSKYDRFDEGFGEKGGFKRNIQSYRRFNFGTPNLWGKSQESRMRM